MTIEVMIVAIKAWTTIVDCFECIFILRELVLFGVFFVLSR